MNTEKANKTGTRANSPESATTTCTITIPAHALALATRNAGESCLTLDEYLTRCVERGNEEWKGSGDLPPLDGGQPLVLRLSPEAEKFFQRVESTAGLPSAACATLAMERMFEAAVKGDKFLPDHFELSRVDRANFEVAAAESEAALATAIG